VPELPEVETVRAGLQRWVVGRTVTAVEVFHPRSIRRHVAGASDFAAILHGARFTAACRRGKYLWLPLSFGAAGPPATCLVGHLGMSGQFLVLPADAPDGPHLRVRISFGDDGPQLRFVDQRTFGGLVVDDLVPATDRDPADTVPALVSHIARDPLDPAFDDDAFIRALRRRDSAVKRALLDQSLISGVGNIYADEALWRTWLHGARLCRLLTRSVAVELLGNVRAVLGDAMRAGGTSFDALYVSVNGESGYFERSLAVYGREGRPCLRCGTALVREPFMNRSSFSCPRCQRRPRRSADARWTSAGTR
jgi:formamidopyrimidine-DNA glycosylase